MTNSEFPSESESRLSYLPDEQRREVIGLFLDFPSLFNDVPSCTNVLEHAIDVGGAAPIRQRAYSCSSQKREVMKSEVDYQITGGLMPSVSDSFPLPRMEDCVGSIGPASFITQLELLKGYWQVLLTPRASQISALVTPDHFMQYTVTPFGLKNAPATFQRSCRGCKSYVWFADSFSTACRGTLNL